MSTHAFFADYSALLAHLDGRGLFRITPGLERIQTVLKRLQLQSPSFAAVQVVGTNGKGSTSTMLSSLGQAHGLRTGLYTSPHFLSPRERIRINNAMLPESEWVSLANAVMATGEHDLSYFELITAMAVLAFARNGVDMAVLETGLGGSWDATTAVAVDLVLFTPIGLDHQSVLGTTLTEIATDKAGAMRPGVPALSLSQEPEVTAALSSNAKKIGALFTVMADAPLPSDVTEKSLALQGEHQLHNARLALAGWRLLNDVSNGLANNFIDFANSTSTASARRVLFKNFPKSDSALEAQGLTTAWLPGRMQRVAPSPPVAGRYSPCPLGHPPLLLDGAHNAQGMAALGLALVRGGIAPAAVIFSCLADKEPHTLIPHLRALATGPIFVPPIADNPRAMPPHELVALIGINATPAASLQEAMEMACAHMAERLPESFLGNFPNNPLLVCGSLYLLGECYALFPELLEITS